ncbi:hypothetical protein NKJ95_23800 [Mesorhizobium sp. M0012]|uniref:tetratricopeptide repeat protein n=1 Tax=Mesorhizobium sp. M0012 TaxID=2956840 RepID=UPI003335A4D3
MFQTSFEQPASSGLDAELFEDLDVSDPRFEDWIRGRRLATTNPCRDGIDHSPSKAILLLERRKTVAFIVDCAGSGPARQLASRFFALTSKAIGTQVRSVSFCEAGNATECETFDGAAQVIAMRSVVRDGAPRGSLSVTISDASSGCVFWTESTQLVLDADESATSSEFYSIVSHAADAAVDTLVRGNGPADGHDLALRLFNSARLLTMTLGKENLALADRQCAAAFEMSPHGGPLAWRALIRQISHFQYMTCDFLPCDEPAGALAARALEAFPGDSMAQCVGAHTEYLFGGNTCQAMRLAKRSIQANPLNAVAWAALANLQTATSDYRTGYDSARRAVDLSAGTRATYFFEFYGCIAAAGLGNYQLAMRHARAAARLSPNFAPPRRYLVALMASANDGLGFRSALQELRRIEPSFEMKLLLDGSYPVNTMRRIPLIDNVEGRLRSGMAALLEHH